MKKKFLFMFMAACVLASLTSCQSAKPDAYLNYPDLEWGMTPEEVFESMEIREENIENHDIADRTESYRLTDVELFGEEPSTLVMNFMDMTYSEDFPYGGEEGAKRGLVEILAYYPEDADMDGVMTQMKKVYGNPLPEIYEFEPGINRQGLREEPTKESDTLKLWGGPVLSEVIEEDSSHQYRDMWKTYYPGIDDENWELFYEKGRLVTGTYSDDVGAKGVSLNAYHFMVYNELQEYFGE